jgi:hypothetical protein
LNNRLDVLVLVRVGIIVVLLLLVERVIVVATRTQLRS